MKVYRVIFEVKENRTENTYFYEIAAMNKKEAIEEVEYRWYKTHTKHMFHMRAERIETQIPINRFQWDIEGNYKYWK